jgi:hypothetical protein
MDRVLPAPNDDPRMDIVRTPDPSRLPQPAWRLIGFASIGVGTGLFSAEVPFVILAAAFLPALIALVVIASQATAPPHIQSARVEQTSRSRARR